MREDVIRPDTDRALRTLKAFQRDTVDYVYRRMYQDEPPARRFLIADEVGLGKTLVARGVVARMIDHLWDTVDRIDIVYICSNSGIARQNISKLNITGHTDHRLPDRITLLPRDVRNLRNRRLNFISFTPGTSFNLRSTLGVADERALLYWLLPDDWKSFDQGTISLLTGTAARSGFKKRVDDFRRWYGIDEELGESFRRTLGGSAESIGRLKSRFLTLSEQLGRREDLSDPERNERTAIVGDLRGLLSRVCIGALEPDLIILDEFQRFKDLLHGDDFPAELARALFTYENVERGEQARVMLLSATPYKMYTTHDESSGDDHFRDFLETIRFLHHDAFRTETFRATLETYRRELFRYGAANVDGHLRSTKEALEAQLRQVMVRTERLAVTADRNGMLVDVPPAGLVVQTPDLLQYVALQRVARTLDHPDTLEFWKSAPYALNFMDDYKLKEQLAAAAQSARSSSLFDALAPSPQSLLSRTDLEAYRRIDPANARLRSLLGDTLDRGAARLFWVPPSCPYYRLEGPFAAAAGFTKRLVFSAWRVVPKVVASVVSFEAERQLFGIADEGDPGANTETARRRRRGLLRYSASEGRLAGMPVLALVYPSPTLAALGDPLRDIAGLPNDSPEVPGLQDVLQQAEREIGVALAELDGQVSTSGPVDQRWYWAAPILLDLHRNEQSTRTWFGQANLAAQWAGHLSQRAPVLEPDAEDQWTAHVEEARDLVRGRLDPPLGTQPDDLAEVLALMAVAGPGTSALRALTRLNGGFEAASLSSVRNAAGEIAEGLRSLFNQPEVTTVVRDADPYWRRVLEYCARGCLSAVLDEYAHVAFEADGLAGKRVDDVVKAVASRTIGALTLQTATLRADILSLDAGERAVRLDDTFGFRTAFAVRYGARGDEGEAADRNQRLQTAFNSPFWPFVLCSTSVGQEGLDFHWYCHAVVHWNLPSNPVDLEQREGRVHRYKGHAVRRNVASRHREDAQRARVGADPWVAMFRAAHASAEADDSDLVPYWVYGSESGARIERHVPALPLSHDAAHKLTLQRSLTVYRMAFGQNRQEDLVAFLQRAVPQERHDELASDLTIDLSPPRSAYREESGVDDAVLHAEEQIQTLREPPASQAAPVAARNLDRFEKLLDAFHAVRPGEQETVRAVSTRRQTSSTELVDRFRSLLDAFGASTTAPSRNRKPTERGAGRQPHSRRISAERLKDLLDRFAALSPVPVDTADRVPALRELLDRYAELHSVTRGSTRRG